MQNVLSRDLVECRVNFPVCLAPMVGLSHVALRHMVRRYQPLDAVTIWPTEMLNSRRLPTENIGNTVETKRDENETMLVPQILGNEQSPIQESIQRLKNWGAVGIDINMGCPVRKALRHNYGVALMGDPDYAAEVVRFAKDSSDLPVGVKLRAGFQNDDAYLAKFVLGLEKAGADWICLHPRQAGEGRRGVADWLQIRRVREILQIPVIGNGDVQTLEDFVRMKEVTGCDSVMIGRALTARPWLLWQIGELMGLAAPDGMQGLKAPKTPEEEGAEFHRAILSFVESIEKHFDLESGLKRINFFLRNAHPWLEFGHALAAKVSGARHLENVRAEIDSFFSLPQRMSARTELRY